MKPLSTFSDNVRAVQKLSPEQAHFFREFYFTGILLLGYL